jgi:hypothetical protein
VCRDLYHAFAQRQAGALASTSHAAKPSARLASLSKVRGPLATHAVIAAHISSNLLFGLFFLEGTHFQKGRHFAQLMKCPVNAHEKDNH